MSNEQILKEEFNLIRVDLIREYEAKGMRASGQFARELTVETSPLSATLRGMDYSEQLEFGREPTKGPNRGGPTLIEKIKVWIEDKGIKPLEKKLSISSLAYLIARKIHRDGWKRSRHGGVELLSKVITPERIQRIINRVSEFNVSSISSEIKRMYEEVSIV